jgi:hypothetical protein
LADTAVAGGKFYSSSISPDGRFALSFWSGGLDNSFAVLSRVSWQTSSIEPIQWLPIGNGVSTRGWSHDGRFVLGCFPNRDKWHSRDMKDKGSSKMMEFQNGRLSGKWVAVDQNTELLQVPAHQHPDRSRAVTVAETGRIEIHRSADSALLLSLRHGQDIPGYRGKPTESAFWTPDGTSLLILGRLRGPKGTDMADRTNFVVIRLSTE